MSTRPLNFVLLLQLLLLFDTVIATVIAVASSNSTAASQDPACTRDPRHTHAAHGRGARRGNGPTVGGGGAERRRSERQGSSATSPRGGGACRWQGSAGCCARGEKRGRPHGQRAHKCAPAKPRRSAATPGGGRPKRCRPRRTGRPRGGRGHETTKAVTLVDRTAAAGTATIAMAAMASDRTAAESMEEGRGDDRGDGGGRLSLPRGARGQQLSGG